MSAREVWRARCDALPGSGEEHAGNSYEAKAKAEPRTIVQAAPVVMEEKTEPLLPTELLPRNGSQNGNGLHLAGRALMWVGDS
jgi:hypothetical protein